MMLRLWHASWLRIFYLWTLLDIASRERFPRKPDGVAILRCVPITGFGGLYAD